MHRYSLPLIAVAAALVLAACGSSNSNHASTMTGSHMASGSGTSVSGLGNGTDMAFVSEMIPHHRSAIAMAEIAQAKSQRPKVQKLASNIIRAQQTEIGELDGLRSKFAKGGVKPGSLGLDQMHMGMTMNTASLRTANPFDRAFIDMMSPHHRGAIAMARVELAKGANQQAKTIATGIISAQQREIKEMAAWRKAWYGSASGPAMSQ